MRVFVSYKEPEAYAPGDLSGWNVKFAGDKDTAAQRAKELARKESRPYVVGAFESGSDTVTLLNELTGPVAFGLFTPSVVHRVSPEGRVYDEDLSATLSDAEVKALKKESKSGA